MGDATMWLDLDARADSPDYTTDLPGAELDGLYEIQSAGEVFKLMARLFAYLDGTPDGVEMRSPETESVATRATGADDRSEHGSEPAPGIAEPAPSRLDFARVTLGAP